MKRTISRFSGGCLVLTLSLLASAPAARAVEVAEVRSKVSRFTSGGAVYGRALDLSIAAPAPVGPIQLTIGQTEGALSSMHEKKVLTDAVLPDGLFVRCEAGALRIANPIEVNGVSSCIDRSAARSKGLNIAESSVVVTTEQLESAGLISFTDRVIKDVSSSEVGATATAALIGNTFAGRAQCTVAQPNAKASQAIVPDALKGVLTASAGLASCATASGTTPALTQNAGVADVAVTVNQTLLGTTQAQLVGSQLDEIQRQLAGSAVPAALKDPVNTAIDTLQRNLAAAPVLGLALGPQESTITSAAGATSAVSRSRAVVLDLINGLARVEVASANATASVAGDDSAIAPTAQADPALVRVKVLNITLPNPAAGAPLIDQAVDPRNLQASLKAVPAVAGVIEPGDDEIVLFRGTLLETHIVFAAGKTCVDPSQKDAACTLPGDTTKYNATSAATAVRIVAFGKNVSAKGADPAGPLPVVSMRLAEAQAAAFRSPQTGTGAIPFPVLPRTGPFDVATVGGGAALLALTVLVRRRAVRGRA